MAPGESAPPCEWAHLVESGIRNGLLVLVAAQAGVSAFVAQAFVDFARPAGRAAALLLATSVACMVTVAWTGRGRRLGCVLVTALTIAGVAAGAHATIRSPELADTWWPTLLLIATGTFLTLTWPRRGWMLGVVLLVAHVVTRAHTWTANPVLPGLTRGRELWAGTGQLAALSASAWIAGALCRRVAADVSSAHALAEAARRASLVSAAERLHQAEADRIVHDEVVHTLRALTLAGETISLDDARVAARDLKRRLAGESVGPSPPPRLDPDLRDFLASLNGLSPSGSLAVTFRGPRELPLFPRVRAALSAATREALRNAALHSGVEVATVDLSVRNLAVQIEVRDQGRGFVPAITEGRGLSHSVVGRLEDVGGHAEIISAPGAGTRVRLTWSPVPRHRPSVLGGGAVNAMFPSLAMIAATPLALGLWLPAFVARDVAHPGIVAFTSVLVVLAGLTLARGAGTRLVTGAESAAVIAVAWTATAVNALALPHDGGHGRLLWIPGVAASLASMLSIFRPLREAVVCGVGVSVIGMVLCWQAIPDSAAWPAYLAPVMTPLITVVLAIVVRRTGDGMAWDILRTQRESAELALDPSGTADVRRRVARRIALQRAELDSLVDAILQPACELDRIRPRAALLEQRFREDLMFAENGRLRPAIEGLRERGWAVRVRVADGLPAAVDGEAAAAISLFGTAPPGGIIDISALGQSVPGDPSPWRLGLLVRPHAGAAAVDDLEDRGWLLARLPGAIRLNRSVTPASPTSSNAVTGGA